MAKTFRVDVVSPESIVWSGDAEFLLSRTTEGEIGIFADHEPTMGALATGTCEIVEAGGKRIDIAVHGGFLQIFQNQVTLLSDRAEIAEGDKEALLARAAELRAEEEGED